LPNYGSTERITTVPAVKAGFSPLDRQLQLIAGHWSEGVVSDAVWVSGLVSSYAHAEEVLRRIGRLDLSTTSAWRQVQVWGAKFGTVLEAERQQANALPEQWDPPSRAAHTDQRMGVSMDGTMIHIRQEGWKELKVGAVFDVAVRPTVDRHTKEWVELAHAVNNSYAAHLGGPDRFGEHLWAEARRRHWEQAQDTEAVGDGAAWIWNQVNLHFGASRQLVDWYHAKQHLIAAAKLLKGDGTPAMQRWLNSRETQLYQGHADRISCELEQAAAERTGDISEALKREAGYFWQNQHRMNYLEMREEEWPLGSGMVESAGKQFKMRLAGPGMRWSRQGAQNLLPVRSAILSGRFDELRAKARNLPQA
jgi:hypothetical protein